MNNKQKLLKENKVKKIGKPPVLSQEIKNLKNNFGVIILKQLKLF